MSFQTTERIFALAPELVPTLFASLLETYGELLPDGHSMVRTIGAHWDDAARTRMRAASLDAGTITPMPLSDGRVAFRCLWQTYLAMEFDAFGMEGVAELTEEELQGLLVVSVE